VFINILFNFKILQQGKQYLAFEFHLSKKKMQEHQLMIPFLYWLNIMRIFCALFLLVDEYMYILEFSWQFLKKGMGNLFSF